MELRFTEAGQLEEGQIWGRKSRTQFDALFEMPVRHCMVQANLLVTRWIYESGVWWRGPSWRSPNMGNH